MNVMLKVWSGWTVNTLVNDGADFKIVFKVIVSSYGEQTMWLYSFLPQTDSPVANKNKPKAWEKSKKKSKSKKAKNKKQQEQAKKKANKAKNQQQQSAEQNHVENGSVQEVEEKGDGSGDSGGSESEDEQEETNTQDVQGRNSARWEGLISESWVVVTMWCTLVP